MKRALLIVPTLVGVLFLTGCSSLLLGSSSGSNSGFYDYDDSISRNTQEEVMRESQWATEQAALQETAAANQSTIDASNAASAAAAASAAVGIGQ